MNNKKLNRKELSEVFNNAMRGEYNSVAQTDSVEEHSVTTEDFDEFEPYDIDDFSHDRASDGVSSGECATSYCADDFHRRRSATQASMDVGSRSAVSEQSSADSRGSKKIGALLLRTANDVIEEGRKKEDPKALYSCFWNEGEIACLFADSNVGKSILSVQIADEITRNLNRKVHYYDFELSEKQFQLRYTDETTGESHRFSNLLKIAHVSESMISENFENQIIDTIENGAVGDDCSIIIIDNISALNNHLETGEAAGQLMLRLMDLKHRLNLSVLVIAHTPKRDMTQPITQNDLAGSKRLFNFFDSVFSMGKSAVDSGIRYIKQIKSRNGRIIYDTQSVLIGELEKEAAMPKFVASGTVNEYSLLKVADTTSQSVRQDRVAALSGKGKSCREISEELGISKSAVSRILCSLRQQKVPNSNMQ